ncbi:hypothetical protein K438DRAFT_2138306, partial [Mycena galopus ATCC 62051]
MRFMQELHNSSIEWSSRRPRCALKHNKFRQLLNTPAFSKKIAAFVIDEVHCIAQCYSNKFRVELEYADLGTLHSFVPSKVSFVAVSATIPPLVLAQIRKTLHISPDTSYHVNLGMDRPNIAWFVQPMKGAKGDLEALDFIFPPHDSEDSWVDPKQTMVFFDDINLAMDALEHARDRLPRRCRGMVAL